MNMTHALTAATATKTLLDPWRTPRARVLLGLGIFASCVVVWMLITGFDATGLTRSGPWVLLSMALVCVVAQLLVGAGLRFMPAPRSPTLSCCLGWCIWCAWSLAFWRSLRYRTGFVHSGQSRFMS